MTQKETIKQLESLYDYCENMRSSDNDFAVWERDCEAIKIALSALRPITREQIAEVFPGCDFCNIADFGEFGFEITKHYAKIACALGSWRFPQHEQFLICPKCGKPLTDEAVDMVMERLEALWDE